MCYSGNHIATYKSIKSTCCIPWTHTCYANYISVNFFWKVNTIISSQLHSFQTLPSHSGYIPKSSPGPEGPCNLSRAGFRLNSSPRCSPLPRRTACCLLNTSRLWPLSRSFPEHPFCRYFLDSLISLRFLLKRCLYAEAFPDQPFPSSIPSATYFLLLYFLCDT